MRNNAYFSKVAKRNHIILHVIFFILFVGITGTAFNSLSLGNNNITYLSSEFVFGNVTPLSILFFTGSCCIIYLYGFIYWVVGKLMKSNT